MIQNNYYDQSQGAPFCSGGSGSHLALVGYFTSLQNEHHRAGIRQGRMMMLMMIMIIMMILMTVSYHHCSHPRVSLLCPGPLVGEEEGAEVGHPDQDYDCPTFITPTFITSDIHHPLIEFRHSSPWTFITPYLK